MSLSTYHKKRKFSRTPEPKGKKEATTGPLRFVIQRHEATRLHYDFRLELDGVLKSWAVPKGPSLRPEDKHLAVRVEDHPLDYASFEGIIPKGNYGAGTVMVWDEGVYTPLDTVERSEAEEILKKQLKKGHLTFVLLGHKLKGEFALIKTHNDEETWLLIKKGDEFASTKDILKEDKSVVTGRTMKQIASQAEAKNEVWHAVPAGRQGKRSDIDLSDLPKSKIPEKVKPMLAESVDEPFDKKDWLFEMKWDGYRTIAIVDKSKVKLFSRNYISYDEKFEPIKKSLEKFPTSAVLDGEVVVLNREGHPQFQWLQDYPESRHGELIYYVFDILYYDGRDTKDLPLTDRKELLKKILPDLPHVRYSEHIEQSGIAFFQEAQKIGVEGIMAKKSNSTYKEGKRSPDWLKIKTIMRQEAIICGYTRPKGSRKHFGALVLGMYKGKKLTYIGHAGGGFTDRTLKALLKQLEPLRQDHSPFKEAVETNAPVTWVKPKLVAEVSFSQWTRDHQMRHPLFLGLREDKDPKDVAKESTKPVIPDLPAGRHGLIGDPVVTPVDSRVRGNDKKIVMFSNLDKVFWPEEKYTKGDLIDYYKEISKVLLPYLKDRPESLLRYPNGIKGESFYQKNVKGLVPNWIGTVRIQTENHDIEYMLCQDEDSLLYMINLGCIDLNPWSSRIHKLENPDYLLIDLDPHKADFSKVITVALTVRDVLEELGIISYPKTSGAKGFHIYIPMGAKYTYEQVKHFAELLCIQVHNKIPDISSLIRSPEKREGKVYLDYLQNRHGQTLATAYSVRAMPGATVSTPLLWSEVTSNLHPSQFTMKNTMKRIQKHGDLFKSVLGKGINIEKTLKVFESKFSS